MVVKRPGARNMRIDDQIRLELTELILRVQNGDITDQQVRMRRFYRLVNGWDQQGTQRGRRPDSNGPLFIIAAGKIQCAKDRLQSKANVFMQMRRIGRRRDPLTFTDKQRIGKDGA